MTMENTMRITRQICELAPVIPVLIVSDVAAAVPLANALVAGGLPALEVTLRTPEAIDVISEMATVEGGVVGAGTLLSPSDVRRAKDAGAKFGVSPGVTTSIIDACRDYELPLLPGAATPSEVMFLLERGYTIQKYFPAEINGGVAGLKAFSSPLSEVSFCPTGGVSLRNASEYLALPNVLCVGGSWVAPQSLIAKSDWAGITQLAREAAKIR